MQPLEPSSFPRTTAYLAQVPGGLNAYPECSASTDVPRIIVEEFPQVFSHGVSAGFRQSLFDAAKHGDRLPDAWSVIFRLMLRDRAIHDDTAYIRWHLEMASRVFKTPRYRVLMYVLSPSLVLAGAQRRWNAFRTGTHLSADGDKSGATATLTYPRLLYPELIARVYGESFRAALQAARAQDVVVELTSHSETVAKYTIRWR